MGIVQKDALRTTIVSIIGMVLGYVNKVLLFVILLTPEEVGLVNLILQLGLLFSTFANLGTINSTWKFFPYLNNPEKRHHGFLSLSVLITLVGVVFFSLIYLIFRHEIANYFLDESKEFMNYYLWVLPVGIFIVFFKLFENYLRGLFKNVFAVIANDFILRVMHTIILGMYALSWFNFETFLIAILLSQAIPTLLLIGYLVYLKEWHIHPKIISIPKKFQRIIVSFSLYSYMNTLAATLVISIDTIMIAGMKGLSALGVYSIVMQVVRAIMIPYSSITRVSSPLIAQHWKDRDMEKMSNLYKRMSSVTLFIGLFFFLGTWVSIDEIFSLLPEKYSSGIPVFFALMIGRVFDMYMGLNGTILVTSKKYKYDILFTATLIGVVYLLNLYLIPIWGIEGAAISTTIAYLLYNVLRLFFVWKWFKLHPFKRSQFGAISLFLGLFFFFFWLDLNLGNVWLTMLVNSMLVVLLYPVVLYVAKIEPEIVEYVDKVLALLKLKTKKN